MTDREASTFRTIETLARLASFAHHSLDFTELKTICAELRRYVDEHGLRVPDALICEIAAFELGAST